MQKQPPQISNSRTEDTNDDCDCKEAQKDGERQNVPQFGQTVEVHPHGAPEREKTKLAFALLEFLLLFRTYAATSMIADRLK